MTRSVRAGVAAVVTGACWLVADATLLACPICFRVEENATTDGVQAAVLVLVGVTTIVLGAFGTFALRLARQDGREAAASQIADSRCAKIPGSGCSQLPDSSCPELPDSSFQIQ